MKKYAVIPLFLCVVSLTTPPQALADESGGVGFSRNRLIFPATQRSITLSVSNNGNATYLVQAGVSGSPDKKTPAPFVVTPPLFRLEGKSQNAMRIVAAGGQLPTDRESLFYFSGTVIPGADGPVQAKGSGATLSIAMRSLLKLFWRPAGLKPSPQEAPGKMQFLRVAKGVLVKNPTPYYQSFAQLQFDGKEQNLDAGPSMVSPYGEQLFPSATTVATVTWRVMNDYGGTTLAVTQSLSATGGAK